ncbi:MAG: phosphatidylserine/phosphatidylglycerophosphate/cardiolipin synthase family protein [Sinobacteraceae bacterium]|nr:phosphatidylserine/phosphatidylglycerophosphate/cardiolipin synthase family protein [Nevskiaceae bacterium]MCP5472949.1 phosphatidylserine/phosphatidylglycerophosphate/cardiolipin synthase family protein [Nevskiaceae bacterium]
MTVTFMWADFRMPDGRGSALEVLSRAAARGLDVRLICWRPDPQTAALEEHAFWGSPEHHRLLGASDSAIRIRWDRAQPGFCQHQKSWLIDAGTDGECCFVGGINLNPHSMVAPGHRGEGQNHDAYLELSGPSVVDVHHNFVQRWNEASERDQADGRWGSGSETDLPFPTQVPDRRGEVVVQIQRTVPCGRLRDGRAVPGAAPFDIAAGEQTNFEQYCRAIAAARRSIYLENQQADVPEIVEGLGRALQRGVEVVMLVPAAGRIPPQLLALGSHGNFTLAGIAGLGLDGRRKPVWVHSKLMVVDGRWGTLGSCNLHRYSLFGNCEMNVAFWDERTARSLLSGLLHEHLGRDVSGMDDRAALRLFRSVAAANRRLFDAGRSDWQGIAFDLLPPATGLYRP